MDDFSTSDTPPVSGGTESPSSPAESSVGVVETPAVPAGSPVETPQPAQPQPSVGVETVDAASGDEFPDDAAFQQLPGEQRGSQWKNARSRIAELNNQVRQYAELGEVDQLKADVELTRSLFGYRQDADGNVVIDQDGLPQPTALPFLRQLREQAPDTFYTMMWEGLREQIDQDEKVGDWLFQQYYGLNPQLLDIYKQIQSPQDALRYAPQLVDPAELTGIPRELHEAYKSFSPEDRDDLQDLYVRNEQRFLARLSERQENLDNQKFIAEQRQREEQSKQEQRQQWENGIKQKTLDRGNAKWEQTVASQQERLKTQYQPFGIENSEGNEMVYSDIVTFAESALKAPALQQKIETAWNQYYLHEYYSATGNQILAARSLADADKLALELQREFAKAATQRVEQWNKHLKGRTAPSAPVNGATRQPALNNAAQTPNPANNGQPQYKEPGRFGLSPGRINEIAAQLAMEKARGENRPPGV